MLKSLIDWLVGESGRLGNLEPEPLQPVRPQRRQSWLTRPVWRTPVRRTYAA